MLELVLIILILLLIADSYGFMVKIARLEKRIENLEREMQKVWKI